MFEGIVNFFKRIGKKEQIEASSKETAKERLHLVLMQDRANVSADFLDMMRREIIEVIKKYIDVDENEIDVRLTNGKNEDGTTGAPALYANIPIAGIKEREPEKKEKINPEKIDEKQEEIKEEVKEIEKTENIEETTETEEKEILEEKQEGTEEEGNEDSENVEEEESEASEKQNEKEDAKESVNA